MDVITLNKKEWDAFLTEVTELSKKYELLLSDLNLAQVRMEELRKTTTEQSSMTSQAIGQVGEAVGRLCDDTERFLNDFQDEWEVLLSSIERFMNLHQRTLDRLKEVGERSKALGKEVQNGTGPTSLGLDDETSGWLCRYCDRGIDPSSKYCCYCGKGVPYVPET